jgi:hypothetical protein
MISDLISEIETDWNNTDVKVKDGFRIRFYIEVYYRGRRYAFVNSNWDVEEGHGDLNVAFKEKVPIYAADEEWEAEMKAQEQ